MSEKTIVIFRRIKDGDKEVVAIFPYEIATLDGCVSSYLHFGQHGSASLDFYQSTLPANVLYPDVLALKEELESVEYVLQVNQRINYAKYRSALKDLRILMK